MKVLLVSINRVTSPYPVYPIGLDYVARSIEADHRVEILDLAGSQDNRPLMDAIKSFGPDVVGISLRNIDNTDSAHSQGFIVELEKAVADVRALSQARVVLGGAGFTLFPDELVARVGADFGLIGEGERFADLLSALADERSPAGIEGVVVAGARQTALPKPYQGQAARVLPEDSSRIDFYLKRGGMLNLQTKRGCPFQCFYCTYPLIEGKSLRRVEPEQAGAQARALQEAGARYLFIADSVFNSDHSHALAVAEAMRAAGLSIPWGAFFAPLAAPAGFYQSLADCGCTHVEFGTDTLSPKMLRSYRKSFSAEDVATTHAQAVAAGLHVAHYFMLGGPGESERTVEQTLDAAEALSKTVCFFFCGIRIYPGTELHRIAIEQGLIGADDDLLDPVFYQPTGISASEVIKRVEARSAKRSNWVIGTGGEQTDRILERMYARGRTGPLWEFLIR